VLLDHDIREAGNESANKFQLFIHFSFYHSPPLQITQKRKKKKEREQKERVGKKKERKKRKRGKKEREEKEKRECRPKNSFPRQASLSPTRVTSRSSVRKH
jgi:hypothetical protein